MKKEIKYNDDTIIIYDDCCVMIGKDWNLTLPDDVFINVMEREIPEDYKIVLLERFMLRHYEDVFKIRIKEYIEDGALTKDKLVDGKYYQGECRNATVARWNANKKADKGRKDIDAMGCFTYMRTKFRDIFPEDINHFEDDNGYDYFVPYKEVVPEDDEVIRE